MAGMLETMTVNKEKMGQAVTQDFSNATEIADYLANKDYHSVKLMKLLES